MIISRSRLIKIILIAMLVMGIVPPAMDWDKAYAVSDSDVITSTAAMEQFLLSAMNERRGTVQFVYKGKTKNLKASIKQVLASALEKDPYMNYTIESYGYSYKGSSSTAEVTMKFKYRETAKQTAYVDQQVKAILKKIITPGMNDHEKVKAIHDWVVLNLKYDTTLTKYTAYEGLKYGSAVCQGYSLLTYKLLKEAGISNLIVEGTAFSTQDDGSQIGQLHAWNLVKLSGKWYHLDTTWDDPVPDVKGEISTSYYLLSDEQIGRDHKWTKSYPKAVTLYRDTLSQLIAKGGVKAAAYEQLAEELNYHLYDPEHLVTTSRELNEQVREAMAEGSNVLVFRFQGSEAELRSVLQDVYQLGIKSLTYQHQAFEDTEDLRVQVKWS